MEDQGNQLKDTTRFIVIQDHQRINITIEDNEKEVR